MWLINWKLHFLEWKTRSFAHKFSPQKAENHISGLWNVKFSGAELAQSPPQRRGTTAPCSYSWLLDSNLLTTSIFIETPAFLRMHVNHKWDLFPFITNQPNQIYEAECLYFGIIIDQRICPEICTKNCTKSWHASLKNAFARTLHWCRIGKGPLKAYVAQMDGDKHGFKSSKELT